MKRSNRRERFQLLLILFVFMLGFSGVVCQTDVNECTSTPCKNGGTCTDSPNGYVCVCPLGFSGPLCQTNINECSSTPCQHGGTCHDGTGTLTCTCPSTSTGTFCEIDVNECATNNGGCNTLAFCTNLNPGRTCTCDPCYQGSGFPVNGCTDINECAVNNGGCGTSQGALCANNACPPSGGQCSGGVCAPTCSCAVGYSGTLCITDINECASNPCQHGATCLDFQNHYTCVCPTAYSGNLCQTDRNDCFAGACSNGGTCVDGLGTYTCTCLPGWSGHDCQTNINECASNPCQNGGTCTDNIPGYTCICNSGFTGTTCVNNNYCASNPCQNGATCINGVGSFDCSCVTGYDGVLCNKIRDPCDYDNGGCSVYTNCDQDCTGFPCVPVCGQCPSGFTRNSNGSVCTPPVTDGSVSGEVINAATGATLSGVVVELWAPAIQNTPMALRVTDGNGKFSFSNLFRIAFYILGTTGLDQSTFDAACTAPGGGYVATGGAGPVVHSSNSPDTITTLTGNLLYGANVTCIPSSPTYALVLADFDITNVSVINDVVLALSPKMANGAMVRSVLTWRNITQLNMFIQKDSGPSQCTVEPTSRTCATETMTIVAANSPFKSVQTVLETTQNEVVYTTFINKSSTESGQTLYSTSARVDYYVGTALATRLTMSILTSDHLGFDTAKTALWWQAMCVDGANGANAVVGIDLFTQTRPVPSVNCPNPFDGTLYGCAFTGCQNGGTCVSSPNAFTCTCAIGFSGSSCQTNVNECSSTPCKNGGTCVDGVNSYTCTCAGGFSGITCQTNKNECASNPCLSGGTCIDGTNSYTCACSPGFSGTSCQTNKNECASNPCRSGGTCVDGTNSYTCTCAGGFSGITCQTNINECASNPCSSHSTPCVDGTNSYLCPCFAGFSGGNCQTNINECASTPCKNSATCVDGVNSYTCTCAPGFSGITCQTNVNECASFPCGLGACIDGSNSFTCSCPPGFSGILCQTDINECASNPCQNGGTCHDNPGSFFCTCSGGHSGARCQL